MSRRARRAPVGTICRRCQRPSFGLSDVCPYCEAQTAVPTTDAAPARSQALLRGTLDHPAALRPLALGGAYRIAHPWPHREDGYCSPTGWCNMPLTEAAVVVRVRGLHYVQAIVQAIHLSSVVGRGLYCTPVRPTREQMRAWAPSLWRSTPVDRWHREGRLIWEAEIGERVQ